MNSIDQNQPEKNREDLVAQGAIEKMKQLVGKADTCFFCTEPTELESIGARPMAVQDVDDEGNLWFLSADDSHKNLDLERNPHVRMFFQGSAHSDFLLVNGTATVTKDPAKIRKLWKPIMKTWFTEGIDDPRISVIKVAAHDGYYWDTKHGNAVAAIKMVIGAAIGKTLDDSIQGRLKIPA